MCKWRYYCIGHIFSITMLPYSFLFSKKLIYNGFLIVMRDHMYHTSKWRQLAGNYGMSYMNVNNKVYVPYKCINVYSTDPPAKSPSSKPLESEHKKKPGLDNGPMITLIGTDNTTTVVPFSDAEKIAKRRDLKLINVLQMDTKTQRPVYRLMTLAQYYEEDKKQKEKTKKGGAFKGEKLLTLSHRISEHDISSRLKSISKWLSKDYEVRIVVNGDTGNMSGAERVYNIIAQGIGSEGRIVQKRQKGSDIRFQILPPKKEKQDKREVESTSSGEA